MKGKAIIQLYDKDGKEIYKQEHKNIITNAYLKLFSPNFPMGIDSRDKNFKLSTLTPIYKKVFGGIMLFSENVEANADNFMINKKHYYDYVGSAGSAFAGDSIYRGSYNETESFIDEENKQITMIWDFPSNAGNGKIKCIGLCPRYLGDAGLIKDENDTSETTLICGYGSDLETPNIENSYNSHSFLNNNASKIGYYLYSKDINTNVYVRHSGKYLYFTEVKRHFDLSLADEINISSSLTLDGGDVNLYKFSDTYTYTGPETIKSVFDVEYDLGYIYYTTITSTDEKIDVKLYKINAENYMLESSNTYTFYITGLKSKTIYGKYINNKIYITADGVDYLYICDIPTLSFKSLEIGDPDYKHAVMRFIDTIMVVRTNQRTRTNNPVFVLGSNDNLCRNNIMEYNYYSSDTNHRPINRVFTNDTMYNYPIGILSKIYYNADMEEQDQVILPHLSSINNVDEFVKYPSNTMKITYILTEY